MARSVNTCYISIRFESSHAHPYIMSVYRCSAPLNMMDFNNMGVCNNLIFFPTCRVMDVNLKAVLFLSQVKDSVQL